MKFDHASDRYGLGEPDFEAVDKLQMHLKEPNIVEYVDKSGKKHQGTWTMIYDEGFEVRIDNHKYFAFSYYKQGSTEHHKKSVCHMTFPGWYHNAQNPDGKSWGCYYASKETELEGTVEEHLLETSEGASAKEYVPEHHLVEHINSKKTTWKAKVYPEFAGRRMHELHSMGGGRTFHPPAYRAPTLLEEGEGDEDDISGLPKIHDWRNVDGQSYVGPVVNQGSCGSCYAVAVTDMIQSRLRVKTKNRKKPFLSVQQVLSCSEYSQGCKGGFPFLVGKYAQDYGMKQYADAPYVGKRNIQCPQKTSTKARTMDYNYVGGYYGACNYKKMMHEIHKNGPLVVGFNTQAGLWHYDNGVYEEESTMSFIEESEKAQAPWGGPWQKGGKHMHNHWEKTTHAVLVVGYGENQAQGKYWIVKNSWGPNWGEKGFFRIGRGTDSCAIESMAVFANPVLGNEDYFEEKVKELGEEYDESSYEPQVPTHAEKKTAAKAEKKTHAKKLGDTADKSSEDKLDSAESSESAEDKELEQETFAKPVSDDIVGDNERTEAEDTQA